MGLTGVIVQATLRAEPLASPWVAADVDRTDGLAQTLELMGGSERHRYSVAWLDLLADGPRMGRAIVSRADPLAAEMAPPPRRLRRASGARTSLRDALAEAGARGSPRLSRGAAASGEHAHVQRAALARDPPSRARSSAGAGAILLPPGRARASGTGCTARPG